jgi:hypothetical protein
MWKVLDETERGPAYKGRNIGPRRWIVECNKCATQIKCESDDFKSLDSRKCFTCLMEERSLLNAKQACLNDCFNIYKKSAKKRKYDFELTKDFFEATIQSNCYYCGVPPCRKHEKERKKYKLNFLVNGIDRLNNTIGYVENNVVPCCSICNRAKGTVPYLDFLSWIARLKGKNMKELEDIQLDG